MTPAPARSRAARTHPPGGHPLHAAALVLASALLALTPPAAAALDLPDTPEPLPASPAFYVWQRGWNPAVSAALQRAAPAASGFLVLGVEREVRGGSPARLALPSIHWAALHATGRAVTLVARSTPPPHGAGLPGDLLDAIRSRTAAATAAGVTLHGLQLDIDVPTSRVGELARWIADARTAAGTRRVTFTALPDHLRSADFASVASAGDGFTLQVHGLDRPASPDAPVQLCDTTRARDWIAAASRLGRPFRVALPTYGYELAFDPSGTFLGLAAEGPARPWPPGTRLRWALAEPAPLAALVSELHAAPPAGFTGIDWFRLPVDGDRLCWDWDTLAATAAGIPRHADLRLEFTPDARDATAGELTLVNRGDAPGTGPASWSLHWSGPARVLAGDGLRGWSLTTAPASLTATAPDPVLLPAGGSMSIGWVRFSRPPAPSLPP